jgi:hypothetical protein
MIEFIPHMSSGVSSSDVTKAVALWKILNMGAIC